MIIIIIWHFILARRMRRRNAHETISRALDESCKNDFKHLHLILFNIFCSQQRECGKLANIWRTSCWHGRCNTFESRKFLRFRSLHLVLCVRVTEWRVCVCLFRFFIVFAMYQFYMSTEYTYESQLSWLAPAALHTRSFKWRSLSISLPLLCVTSSLCPQSSFNDISTDTNFIGAPVLVKRFHLCDDWACVCVWDMWVVVSSGRSECERWEHTKTSRWYQVLKRSIRITHTSHRIYAKIDGMPHALCSNVSLTC